LDQIVPFTGPQRGRCNACTSPPASAPAGTGTFKRRLLHVTEGVALIQVRSGEVVVIRAGHTVWCPPGQWRWHGAAPDHFMTHLAIWDGLADGQDGPETEWRARVTDEEYTAR
jgi:hypothetical protein